MRFNEFNESIDPGAKAAIKGMRQLSGDQYYGLYKTMKDVAGHDGKKQTSPEGDTDHEVSDKPFAYAYTDEEKNMIKGVDPKAKQITSDKSEELDEGEGDLATALSKISGSWSGWHKEEDMSSPDIDVYEYDDGEGGYYGRGTIEHNLKSGEVKVEYHDSENDADVDGTFKNMGDAMRALRGQWGQNHGGKAPNFDRLGQRKQHGPDDLRKTDRTGRKGTLAGGPTNSLKQAIQWNKGKHGPVGKLPEGRYDNRDAYQRDYDNSQTGFGRGERDSERHDIDTNNEYRAEHGTWYVRIDGIIDPTPYQGKAAANAAGLELKKQPGNENKLFMLTTKA